MFPAGDTSRNEYERSLTGHLDYLLFPGQQGSFTGTGKTVPVKLPFLTVVNPW
ncbi:hypothetical protein [Desulfopila sp. IMCC35006]|uniref:hypothetical protein n=1 Tax=Desulfopila sp. IMCC35006 TaxID=2569542 RepID=UPI00129471F0|nr:hypothetical protein [Desulfopila sp. IMCC35006]